MRTVVLTEYVRSQPIALSVAQRDTLGKLVKGLTITPAVGSTDTYTLTSSSTVGVARVGDLTLELRPKIGVAPVLFLISYALNPKSWKLEQAQLAHDANLAEAVIPLFTRTIQQTIRPGLLQATAGARTRLPVSGAVSASVTSSAPEPACRSRSKSPTTTSLQTSSKTGCFAPPWTPSDGYTCGKKTHAPFSPGCACSSTASAPSLQTGAAYLNRTGPGSTSGTGPQSHSPGSSSVPPGSRPAQAEWTPASSSSI
jgi:hypothetical protein